MRKKLIERTDASKPVFALGLILGNKETEGDVGLEIEVEGNKFPKPEGYEETKKPVKLSKTKAWSYVEDGSLRGEDNAEYVLTSPIKFSEIPLAAADLFTRLKEYGSVFDDSNRTSVHVHLNCQKFHFNRLAAFAAVFFAVEEILTEFGGEHRVGNLFCLRGVDAPRIVGNIRDFIASDGEIPLHDIMHYAGFNPHALMKHGSVEIRHMRGPSSYDDVQLIVDWVSILQRLYEVSESFVDPREAVALFSSGGPLSYFDTLLGDKAEMVRKSVGWSDAQISEAMYRGIRLAQQIVYCRDWSEFKPAELKPDPFGRDIGKVAQKMVSQPVPETMSPDPFVNFPPQPEYDYDPFGGFDEL